MVPPHVLLVVAGLLTGPDTPPPPPVRVERNDPLLVDGEPSDLVTALAALGAHEWAGEYSSSGPEGSSRLWLTTDRFGYTWSIGDVLYSTRVARGVVDGAEDDLLVLQAPDELRPIARLERRMHRVRWCGRHYLIPESRIEEFCDAVRLGWERELDKRFLLREADRGLPLSGLPDVPAAWRHLLPAQPVCARIREVRVDEITPTGIDSGASYRLYAVLDAGSHGGVERRMRLTRLDGPWHGVTTVDSVEPDRCELLIYVMLPEHSGRWPEPGWEFSTPFFGVATPDPPAQAPPLRVNGAAE